MWKHIQSKDNDLKYKQVVKNIETQKRTIWKYIESYGYIYRNRWNCVENTETDRTILKHTETHITILQHRRIY